MKKQAIILPPARPGSLGDEAILAATTSYLKKKGFKKISVVSYNKDGRWKGVPELDDSIEMHEFFENNSSKSIKNLAKIMKNYDHFCCLGADVLDGYYNEKTSLKRIEMTNIAYKEGLDSRILGFSFNKNPAKSCIKALNNLPEKIKVQARDPSSYKRLRKWLKRKVELTADVAFLLEPDYNSKLNNKVSKWVKSEHKEGRVVIGINANYKIIQNLPLKLQSSLVKIYTEMLNKLYSMGNFSFLLVPHDFRKKKGEIDDVILTKFVLKSLPKRVRKHSTKIPTPCTAAEIKAFCKGIDFVLSGRMHLAIACLGVGTPTACITYQDKFEGLFKYFNLRGMTINPEKALQPDKLVNFLIPIIKKRIKVSRQIKSKLPQVLKLSKKNFE